MAGRPAPISRASTSRGPSAPLKSHPTTLVSASASLTGTHPISLGSDVIIQLRSRLSSASGPIDIAEGCIIGEQVSIGAVNIPSSDSKRRGETSADLTIARGVLIESRAVVEAASVAAFTIIETGARIGKGAVVGRNCKICAHVEIGEKEVVDDDTVIYGNGWGDRRMEKTGGAMDGKREEWIRQQGAALRKAWTGK